MTNNGKEVGENKMNCVAILVPSTSKHRIWKILNDSYLFKMLQSFYVTCYPPKHIYKIFIGIDSDDLFYSSENCSNFISAFPDIQMNFITCNQKPGHVTAIWNILAEKAIEEGFEYLYACGDDIEWCQPGWVEQCIKILQLHNNIGMTGVRCIENNSILTQCFIHKTHLDIFGFLYPSEIMNWYCDDWINLIYPRTPLDNSIYCKNTGGNPRYVIKQCPELISLVERDKMRILQFKF
jgi:hypothetical protein